MIDLLNLKPQAISKNLKGKFMMFYSLPGAGKTSLAAQFDKCLIAAFECGTNALHNVYVQPIKTWNDWKQMVNQLCKKKELQDKFDTIAIDTADEAWSLCTKYICDNEGIDNLSDLPWGQAYDLAKKEFQSTLRELAFNGYGLIFISHSTEKTYKNEKGEEYEMIVPALQNRPFDIINKMVDIIAYIREISAGEGDTQQRKRVMFLRDEIGDRFLVKSRYRYIKPKIELSYTGLVEAIYEAVDKEVASSGGAATDDKNVFFEQSYEEMMEEAKVLWIKVNEKGVTEKVSAILESEFGKPTKFSEITPEQTESLKKVLFEIRSII